MILGFTGTKIGMTHEQKLLVRHQLLEMSPARVVHGDCVGADDDFDRIAVQLGLLRELYPSDATSYRARGDLRQPELLFAVHEPAPPLRRNVLIVRSATQMLACPKGPEERRSGTWATVRRAVQDGKPVLVIWPDGNVSRR